MIPPTSRAQVSVYGLTSEPTGDVVAMPAVFNAQIRTDMLSFVHSQMRLNKRQPYGVSSKAGCQTSAESWGTGRAVARIPRVRGGGTHRSGQGAFGNMCRGGRMYAPKTIFRKWYRRINKRQRRAALVSAVAGSGISALVFAKGHVIDRVPEIPLVVTDKIQEFKKTKQAARFLRRLRVWPDIEKVVESKAIRATKGKMRNRRYKKRTGPLIIYDRDHGLTKAFRNIPGITLAHISRLNLLQIAPGGHVGRLIIWTESAFTQLNDYFGTWNTKSIHKKNFTLPMPCMFNTDISRLKRCPEIASVCSEVSRINPVKRLVKKNPFRDLKLMRKLNPYDPVIRLGKYLLKMDNRVRHFEHLKLLNTRKGNRMRKLKEILAQDRAKFDEWRNKKDVFEVTDMPVEGEASAAKGTKPPAAKGTVPPVAKGTGTPVAKSTKSSAKKTKAPAATPKK